MKKRISSFLKLVLFFGVGFLILYLLYNNQNQAYQEQCKLDGIPLDECDFLGKILSDFASVNYWWILAILFVYFISNISRTMRWKMLLKPLGYQPGYLNMYFTIMLGYFANLGLPRMGEVVRAGALSRYEKLPAEKVMGTIVTDRVFDLISLLLVVGLAFLLEFDTLWGWLSENASTGEKIGFFTQTWVQFLLVLIILTGVLVFVFRKKLMALSIFKKIKGLLVGFGEGVMSVRKVDQPFWFIFHCISIWVMYYLMAYFCLLSFEPTAQLGPLVALLVFVFGAFGIVIPSPGGMGSYHFLVMVGLALYGVGGSDSFSLANIMFFSVNIFGNVLWGILALIILPIINRSYNPEPVVSESAST
ncbi:MAG: lysylphosphatidylglycerol synthase transmembrane domain-containing protein [Saprospiraceae bacterium]